MESSGFCLSYLENYFLFKQMILIRKEDKYDLYIEEEVYFKVVGKSIRREGQWFSPTYA